MPCQYKFPKEYIEAGLSEKFNEVRKLLDEESKSDPQTEPYKSKYAAIELLNEIQNILETQVDNSKQENNEKTYVLAVVHLNKGIIAVDTEELSVGEENLMKCIDILGENKGKSHGIITTISALNQLGILWSRRDQPVKAKEFLELAEGIFKSFKSLNEDSDLCSLNQLFGLDIPEEPKPSIILEKLHTLTLYYLAQVYGNLNELLKSALYCHMTLKRQLEMKDYDSIDWALNAATLSQFFMEKGGFCQARHHLAAATYILGKYEDRLKETRSDNDNEKEILASKWETFKHRTADVSRCWAKYGMLLLMMSRDRLVAYNETGEKCSAEDTNIQADPNSNISQECLNNLKFESIEKDIEHISCSVTDKYVLDFNDAKQVFLNIQKWLNDAKLFYNLETQASDYVQIIQDMSQSYKYLAFFEENEDRQAKMHKRRIDLLEAVVKELNEKYYQSVCQQIWFELGETYSEILDIKLDRLKATDENPTPQILSKINNLTRSAITNFQNFTNSLNLEKSSEIPEQTIRPALCAYFHVGRLYNKFITLDKKMMLENVKKSLEAYTFLVSYCEKDSKAAELMVEELSVSRDFIKLLPVKISKLTYEISKS
ncbi:hypothetical protein QAD02_012177 [Eretmocerus hayati]|uniref:Uncharacterized protein n=1 Tax=Eretmocerus hayati TaxID=131215 RepID=A0ACC2NYM2_9HYME|nr:hypothetical protein QAD02_012177 [Eretmocerus hayati]